MINTAKAIAANGQIIVHFANVISDQCTDKKSALCETILVSMIYVQITYVRMKANLECCAEMIPTLSTQLRIIASVKASTPDDVSVSQLTFDAQLQCIGHMHAHTGRCNACQECPEPDAGSHQDYKSCRGCMHEGDPIPPHLL